MNNHSIVEVKRIVLYTKIVSSKLISLNNMHKYFIGVSTSFVEWHVLYMPIGHMDEVLLSIGIDEWLVGIVQPMYRDTTSKVRTGKEYSKEFGV